MNRYATAVLVCSVAVTPFTFTSVAQAQDAETPGPAPVEAFMCNMKDGKNRKDLMQASAKIAKWSAKHDPSYNAWILSPQFASAPDTPDFIWLGSNPNGNELGKGIDAWQKSGGEAAEAFNAVADCSGGHVLASSITVNAPDGPPGDGVVMFAQCRIADGSNWMKAVQAHKGFSSTMRGMGAKGSSWMFFPMLGGAERTFSYYGVTTFKNYADFGAAYELYVTGGGYQKAEAAYKGVTDCNYRTPTVWDVKLVYKGTPG